MVSVLRNGWPPVCRRTRIHRHSPYTRQQTRRPQRTARRLGSPPGKRMSFTDEWSEVSIKMPPVTTAGGFSVFQPGTYDGSLEIDWIRLSHSEANIAKTKVPIETFDFSDDHKLGGWGSDITYDVIDGVFVINNSTAAKDYENKPATRPKLRLKSTRPTSSTCASEARRKAPLASYSKTPTDRRLRLSRKHGY